MDEARTAFLKGIRKSAPNDSLILGFTWTGKNCALAREKAALKLRQHLLASAEKYPCAPHVLIGHSHGGNIALRAASKASTPVKIVCLSTPIIYSFPRPRSEAKNAKQVLWGLAVALLLPCILYVAGSRPGLGDGLVWALSFASATAAALIIFAGELHLKWSLSICEFSAVTEGINSASALFLRYPGDEASLALPSFQAIQYLINRLVETAAAIAMRLFNLNLVRRWRGLYFFPCCYFSPLPWDYLYFMSYTISLRRVGPFGYNSRYCRRSASSDTMLERGYDSAATILVYVAGALSPLALFTGIIPFGWRLAAASPWIELSVESAPIGDWNVVTLQPSTESRTMWHALGYEEQAALEQIVKFMKELVGSVQKSS
jgi:hypothetical protein